MRTACFRSGKQVLARICITFHCLATHTCWSCVGWGARARCVENISGFSVPSLSTSVATLSGSGPPPPTGTHPPWHYTAVSFPHVQRYFCRLLQTILEVVVEHPLAAQASAPLILLPLQHLCRWPPPLAHWKPPACDVHPFCPSFGHPTFCATQHPRVPARTFAHCARLLGLCFFRFYCWSGGP